MLEWLEDWLATPLTRRRGADRLARPGLPRPAPSPASWSSTRSPTALRAYAGNYTDYLEQKLAEREQPVAGLHRPAGGDRPPAPGGRPACAATAVFDKGGKADSRR